MTAEIMTLGPMLIGSVRHVGPYAECESAWQTLLAWATENQVLRQDTAFIGICHDDPNQTSPEQIRYDACITVPDGVGGSEAVTLGTIPAGDYLSLTHSGSYEGLGNAWGALFEQELPACGKEFDPKKPCFEQYLNSPQQTAPEELRTRLFVPLK